MNIFIPQENIKISQDLYKSLTPTKRTTFSENMAKRRIPFLKTENKENETTNSIIASHSHLRSKNYRNSIQTKSPLGIKSIEIKNKNGIETRKNTDFNNDLETENWLRLKENLRKIKGKYSLSSKAKDEQTNGCKTTKEYKMESIENGSCKENKQNLNNSLIENIEKTMEYNRKETLNSSDITASSDYYSNNSIAESLANETSKENSFSSIEVNLKPLTNSTFIYPHDPLGNETNNYQTAGNITLEFDEGSPKTKQINGTFMEQNRTETIPCKKYPNYKPENFQIPLIIINEIEIIDYNKKPKEIVTTHLKTLKVPIIPRRSCYEENKDLQKKLIEKELFKQIEIKDKVMQHLLEIALCLEFPKLKHFCRKECEKNAVGLCEKQMKSKRENLEKEEESKGFFKTIWGAIKYSFTANHNQKEKEINKEENLKETKEVNNGKGEEQKLKDKEFIEYKEELEKEEFVGAVKDNEEDLETKDCKLKTVIEIKTDIKQENDKELEQNSKLDKDSQETNEIVYKGIETVPSNKVQEVIKTLEEKLTTKDNIKDLENKMKIEIKDYKGTENTKETIESSKNLTEKPKSKQKMENFNELLKEKATETAQTFAKNEPFKNHSGEVKKKPKTKKRFLFFFHKTEKPKKEENNIENTEDSSKIENMEVVMEELEKAEKTISQEALKKLEIFMAEKKIEQMDQKIRNKRSDSF